MKKLILGGLSAIVSLALVLSVPMAMAQTSTTTGSRNVSELRTVTINSRGTATLNGVVTTAINGSSFSVNSWGGDWTVNASGTTKFIEQVGDRKINWGEMQSGDRVIVFGTAASDTPSIIRVTKVVDRSIVRRTITGTVSGFNGSGGTANTGSFTLTTSGGIVYNVVTAPGLTPGTNGQGITSFGNIADGMTVRVAGDVNNSNDTIFARTIMVTKLSTGGTNTTSTPSTTSGTTTSSENTTSNSGTTTSTNGTSSSTTGTGTSGTSSTTGGTTTGM